MSKCLNDCQEKIEEHKRHLEKYRDIAWDHLRENNLNEYHRGYYSGRGDSYQEALYKISGKEGDRQRLKLD